jgi:hypothetical protein
MDDADELKPFYHEIRAAIDASLACAARNEYVPDEYITVEAISARGRMRLQREQQHVEA